MSLATENPFNLSFTVCGTRQNFGNLRLLIRISQDNAGTNIMWDADAETHGITASLSNLPSLDYELCNSVIVRVWPEHPGVQDSSVELLLSILTRPLRSPLVFSGGMFFLYSPDEETTAVPTPVPTASIPPVSTSEPPVTTVLPTASATTSVSINTISMQHNGEIEVTSGSTPVDNLLTDDIGYTAIHLVIEAVLASLLLVAIVIIVVLAAVIKCRRKTGNIVVPLDLECGCDKLHESNLDSVV